MPSVRAGARALTALLLLGLAGAGCGPGTSASNPTSLWLSYSGREIDLVLVDHEPPPF